ncbi:MAG: glycerol-3-phosphate dehydrogenase/oxidase [Planctomycetia bacterium]
MNVDRPIVVLGAGINGAAIARELTLSGVPVLVVDASDIGCGSTAWSTRLIHGGLRYLEYGELGLVRESLAERDRLVRLAPHLVRPLSFCLPLERRLGGLLAAAARTIGLESLARSWPGRRGRGSIAVGVGLALYDLLAAGSGWPRHRMLRSDAADMPALDTNRFPFIATYSDAQLLWPERFTVELLVDARQAAAAAGVPFAVHTRARARLRPDGSLTATALGHDAPFATVRPAAIVNATGAWADRTLTGLFDSDPESPPSVRRRLIGGTKGSHLVIRSHPLRAALCDRGVYAEATDGRPVFVLPFGAELVLVGTTDIPFTGDPATVRADDAEIDYLLAATGRLFPAAAPSREQVQQHYCGVRPLPARDTANAPASITRRHMLVRHAQAPLPTWSVVGGKLTTCRSLAESAAREILPAIGLPVRGSSRDRPLPGSRDAPCIVGPSSRPPGDARGGPMPRAAIDATAAAARAAGFTDPEATRVAEGLNALFGSRAPEVLAPVANVAPPRLIADTALPLAAVGFCVRDEWAATVEDLVERRLMLAFDPALSTATIRDVAEELARLGRLSTAGVAAAADACVMTLRTRYDRCVAVDAAGSRCHADGLA